jgi:hypothetical protein
MRHIFFSTVLCWLRGLSPDNVSVRLPLLVWGRFRRFWEVRIVRILIPYHAEFLGLGFRFYLEIPV